MEKHHFATIVAVAVLSILCLTPYALADKTVPTYYGPSFEAAPTSLGGPAYITVSSTSGTSYVSPPSSSSPCPSGQTCGYPLQACTDSATFFFSIHSITVTDPDGNVFELGSSVSPGMYWPNIYGGSLAGPFPLSDGLLGSTVGDALNVTIGDNFVLPFGTGAGGFAFHTSLGSPPQTHLSEEGPYYWWTMPGSVYGANKRLDLYPSINPTAIPGTYTVDIEGYAVCSSLVLFQSNNLFTEVSSSIPTPEFPAPLAAVVVASFLGFVLLNKRRLDIRAR